VLKISCPECLGLWEIKIKYFRDECQWLMPVILTTLLEAEIRRIAV
jgi:hypothetical protein